MSVEAVLDKALRPMLVSAKHEIGSKYKDSGQTGSEVKDALQAVELFIGWGKPLVLRYYHIKEAYNI